MSSSLQGLTALMASTAPDWASDPETFYNLATLQNYKTLGYCLRGRPYADVFRTGTEIRERVMFESTPRMHSYLIGDTQDIEVTSPGATIIAYFRTFMSEMSWYEEPLLFNAGNAMGGGATKETWKSLWKSMWMDHWTDTMNYWETYLWRAPSAENDAPTGQEFLSLPGYVNQWLYGQYGTTVTTVNQQNRQTYVNHRNKVSTYATFAQKTPNNVVEGLEDLIMATGFEPPPLHQEYFDAETDVDASGGFFAASKIGRRKLSRCYRDSNDNWVNKTDPMQNPYFAGGPVLYVATLDDAPLYPASAVTTLTKNTVTAGGTGAAATEAACANPGPRIYLLQPKGVKVCWSKDRFMHRLKPINDRANPTLWSQFVNTFGTTYAPMARTLGILIPSADVTAL